MSYMCHCHHCGKRLSDPDDDPIYDVPHNKYYCNQECMDRKTQKEQK